MEDITKRNTETFRQGLETLTNKIYNLSDVIQMQQGAINSLAERLNSMDQRIQIMLVRSATNGPSVKE